VVFEHKLYVCNLRSVSAFDVLFNRKNVLVEVESSLYDFHLGEVVLDAELNGCICGKSLHLKIFKSIYTLSHIFTIIWFLYASHHNISQRHQK